MNYLMNMIIYICKYDQETHRQGFAAFLFLTPLFFSGFLVEFSGSNEEGRGGLDLL